MLTISPAGEAARPGETHEIYAALLADVLDGRLALNDRIPTEVVLAARFRTNRMRVHAAIRTLERHGVVRRNKRQGTFVHRIPDCAQARDLRRAFAQHIHTMVSFERYPTFHWNTYSLRQMELAASARGYQVANEPFPTHPSRAALEATLQRIAAQGSAALILLPNKYQSEFCLKHADLIYQYHRNVCVFDQGDSAPDRWPFHVFALDPFGEGALVGEYVFACAPGRVTFLTPDRIAPSYWAVQRLKGLCFGLRRASDATLTAEVRQFQQRRELRDFSETLKREADRRPTVVAVNDEIATWLVDAARAVGLETPRDYQLIAFDNNPAMLAYNLTTVATPVDTIGSTMAEFVCGDQRPVDGATHLIRLTSHVIERATCQRVGLATKSRRGRLATACSTLQDLSATGAADALGVGKR